MNFMLLNLIFCGSSCSFIFSYYTLFVGCNEDFIEEMAEPVKKMRPKLTVNLALKKEPNALNVGLSVEKVAKESRMKLRDEGKTSQTKITARPHFHARAGCRQRRDSGQGHVQPYPDDHGAQSNVSQQIVIEDRECVCC